MWRFVLGIGLLLGLLLLCLGVSVFAERMHQPVCSGLETAAQLILAGDTAGCNVQIHQAKQQWEKKWHRTAAFSDHTPMDEVDSLFAQLEIYGMQGDAVRTAALCHGISQRIRAIAEAQAPTWWNLL